MDGRRVVPQALIDAGFIRYIRPKEKYRCGNPRLSRVPRWRSAQVFQRPSVGTGCCGSGASYVVSSLQKPPGGPAGEDGQPVGGEPVGEDRRDCGPGRYADAGPARDQGGLDGAEAAGGGEAAAMTAAPR
jgi:hypothetical protein